MGLQLFSSFFYVFWRVTRKRIGQNKLYSAGRPLDASAVYGRGRAHGLQQLGAALECRR